ncbi:unnamed protein product [Rhizophagus irregularis]|nr:unnamed protein product [Rhizophagus irregularis]
MEGGLHFRSPVLENSDLLQVKKGLGGNIVEGGRKRDGTKWAFRTFREVRDQYKGEMEVDEDDDRHFWKQITHHLVINELAAKNVILRFIPYNSNRVPSKAEVKDFDTNNEKMKARLAREDKTKIVEVL